MILPHYAERLSLENFNLKYSEIDKKKKKKFHEISTTPLLRTKFDWPSCCPTCGSAYTSYYWLF